MYGVDRLRVYVVYPYSVVYVYMHVLMRFKFMMLYIYILHDVLSWYVVFSLLAFETQKVYKYFHNEINKRVLNK